MKINNKKVVGIEYSKEKYFAYGGCENCANGLGNNVYDCKAFIETRLDNGNFDYYEIQLCSACIIAYQLYHIDTCLPDYFAGYYKPVLAVPVDSTTTRKSLIDSIVNEYNTISDYLSYGDDAWPELTDDELKKLCADMLLVDDDSAILYPELLDGDHVYSYFGLRTLNAGR
jgi:hypothetical protein